ncbi:unnamed protein product [Anisakis simplex]|uniref:Legumain (inferred by orthology to a human protein) n=1 Tax=Anisakis simplex TaxID=6269 RepID=A0A0M3KDS1_ANISI|nr:unnamed protein product [Anisakis simplex]
MQNDRTCYSIVFSRINAEPEDEAENHPRIWALLVAGSNDWYNYRHQADVCHAYHVLRHHGIPEEHIITMMYDDIANSEDNPYPGKLFNRPHGPDVYHGVKIDYREKDVTPENFLAILQGNSSAVKGGNGRVIKSNAHDHIFVYFTDHGSTGSVAFPYDILSACSGLILA